MAFLVATTSLPAVYRPNGYARTTTTGTPHARAKNMGFYIIIILVDTFLYNFLVGSPFQLGSNLKDHSNFKSSLDKPSYKFHTELF